MEKGTRGGDSGNCGERDEERGLWGKGCGEGTVGTVGKGMRRGDCGDRMRRGDCGERDEDRGLWGKG